MRNLSTMNKGKAISTINVIMVLMLLYAGQASANFKECFEDCAIGCFLGQTNEFKCTLKCFGKCIINPGSSSSLMRLDYCKFGCAVDQCAGFGKGKFYWILHTCIRR